MDGITYIGQSIPGLPWWVVAGAAVGFFIYGLPIWFDLAAFFIVLHEKWCRASHQQSSKKG